MITRRVGIDLALRAPHRATIYEGADPIGKPINVPRTQEGIDLLVRRATTGFDGTCEFIMEPTGLAWLPLAAERDRRGLGLYLGDRVRALAIVVLLLSLALGAGVACSRSAAQRAPVATLPSTPEATAALGPLHDQWAERRLDRGALVDYLKRYPDDGAVPLVMVYLAWAMMDAGDPIAADGVLATIAELSPGTTRDLATVARARSLRQHGAPQSALDSLRPLVGKVVDDSDREVFLEELALSAIGARIDYEALAYLDAWLRGVGEDDRDRIRARVAQLIDTLPRDVLEQTYRTMRARGAASGYGPDTQKLVAARLGRIAVETNDAALARWLLEQSGTSASAMAGDAGRELGELASSRRGLVVVTGKTVGLLLPTRNRELRDEAADVVRGLSFALDLPRSAGRGEGLRLVTRDDGVDEAGTRAAMEELAGEGATVILAGFDRDGADRASKWSEESNIPVLLLTAPSPAMMPKKGAIVLGERPEREIAMLADALSRHDAHVVAFVADTAEDEAAGRAAEGRGGISLLPPVRCDVVLAEAGKPRFPVDSWLSSGAQGWLVSGPGQCARDVLRDLARALERGRVPRKTAPAMALTLEAGIPFAEAPKGVLVLGASAGLVPVLAANASEVREDDVRTFMERFGSRPSYWTALGRDGGALARAAMGPLPPDSTSDVRAVAQRRSIVHSGLLGIKVRLWTSDDKGIGADRVLPRTLRIVTWQREK